MPLLYLSISWIAGTFAGSMVMLPAWMLAFSLITIIPAVFLPGCRKTILLVGLCYLSLMGGALRYQATIQPQESTQLQFYNGKGVVQVVGMVSDMPEVRHSSIALRLSALNVIEGSEKSEVKGDILVRFPFYREFHYGDVLQLTGKLETPQQLEDFDYKSYLANQGIYSIMNYPTTVVLESRKGFAPLAWIYNLRSRLSQSLSAILPQPQSSLAQAILLGLRGNISDDLMQSFYYTGTTHLLAISGMNLTIMLGMVLSAAIWFFGRKNKMYIWLSLGLIWLYAMLTGMPATVVRAAVMGSVFLMAELLGRQRNSLAALMLTAVLMVVAEPRVLWDVSFQLSFLSMLGMVLILPYFNSLAGVGNAATNQSLLGWLKKLLVVGSGTTFAAILATWPVVAMNFHQFSLVSMPATFFAMPALPGLIVLSFVASIAGLVWQPLGVWLGWVAWLFLSYFVWVIQIFSALPFVFIENITFQIYQVMIYYLLLAVLFIALQNSQAVLSIMRSVYSKVVTAFAAVKSLQFKKISTLLLGLLFISNALVWLAFASLPDGKLHVYIFDVGQGESILIRTPDGQNVLIDSGPDPIAASVQLGNRLPFWDRKIDVVMLTQPQSDHASGLLEIIKNYDVRNFVVSPMPPDSMYYQELNKIVLEKSLKAVIANSGQEIMLGRGIRLVVLHPPIRMLQGTSNDINNNNLVLKLSWDKVSFLFTADIEGEAESYLLQDRADVGCNVLKVAHHGSRTSTSDEFLAIARPGVAVISAGAQNRFGHPHRETLERLSAWVGGKNVYLTSKDGTVEFITDGQKLWCARER